MPPFDAVVAEHGAAVLRLCRSRLAAADADDAWSETFLSALRAYPSLPSGSNVRAWLFTIAHHKVADVFRRNGRSADPVDLRAVDLPGGDGIPEPPDGTLRTALARLTSRQRDALVLHHVGGLPYAEVGAVLGSSEQAARRSAADALAILRSSYPRAVHQETIR